ncbi:MAG: hypothetical protein HKN73_17130 [Gemmatimonadetes bacterium]|nr:hypothetical protein [Gemmatimonadota bacterium]
MQQNATELSPQQFAVLELLVGGATVTDAAKHSGVSRSTIHRWLKNDFAFQAELNRTRNGLQEATLRTLLSVAHRAAQNVAEAIEGGDLSVSLKILKGIGALSGAPPRVGADDADVLREETEIDRATEQVDREMRRMLAL